MVPVVQCDSNEDSQGRQLCMNKRFSKVVSSAPRARFQKARPKVPSIKREPASTPAERKAQPVISATRSEGNKEISTVNGDGENNFISSNAKEFVASAVCKGLQSEEQYFKYENQETNTTENESHNLDEVVVIEDKEISKKTEAVSSENLAASHVDQNNHLVSDSDKSLESCSSLNTDCEVINEVPVSSSSVTENMTVSKICESGKDNVFVGKSPSIADECAIVNSINTVNDAIKSQSSDSQRTEISSTMQNTPDLEVIKSLSSCEKRTEISASEQGISVSVPEVIKSPSNSKKRTETSTRKQSVSVSTSKILSTTDVNSKDVSPAETRETLHRTVPNTPTEERNDISPSTTEKSSKYPHLTSILSKKRVEPKRDVQHKKRKRYKKGDTAPERSKMTMEDLIYWNPTSEDAGLKKVSNTNDTPVISNDTEPEECPDEDVQIEEENQSGPVPRLIISEDGEINIDQGSLVIQRKVLPVQNVIERNEDTTYSSFRKRPLSKHWTTKETTIFYKALSLVGTDFGLMEKLLPNRTRRELKLKFKREEKYNIDLVNKAMYDSQLTFDENTLEEHIQMLNSEFLDEIQECDQSSLKENRRSKTGGKHRRKKDENSDIELLDSPAKILTSENGTDSINKEASNKGRASNKKGECNKGNRKKKQSNDVIVIENTTEADADCEIIDKNGLEVNDINGGNDVKKKRKRKRKQELADFYTIDGIDTQDVKESKVNENGIVTSKNINSNKEVLIEDELSCKYGTSNDTGGRRRKKKKLPDDFISLDDIEDITDLTTGVELSSDDDFCEYSPKRNYKSDAIQHKTLQKSPASATKIHSDNLCNDVPENVEIVYLEEVSNVDSNLDEAVVIAEGSTLPVSDIVNNSVLESDTAQTLSASSDNQETECITVNIIQNFDEVNPLNVMANEVVTSQTLRAKRKRNVGSGLKIPKKENPQKEIKQPSFTNYTPADESLLCFEKNLNFSPEPNLKTYSKNLSTPQSADVLISSLQTPSVTPVQSSSLLTSLNISNHQPMAIPLTPQADESPSPVVFMAKSPNTDNVIHLFMYKSPS